MYPGPIGFGGGMGGGGASTELIACLKEHQDGPSGSGEPVISMWGWSGSDKAMTLAKLKELVKDGELHYVQVGSGGGMGGGPGGGSNLSTEVTEWVQKNGTALKASEYSKSATSDASDTSETSTIYRLDPSDVS
ncbi:hypothetical protein AQJ91_15560 [Streptomyces dysideae]|uniref:Putative mannosyltransferase YkcA/B-like C-terminal domain-containing protein n=1 Tax=Streptomyces dysideae TaxID=909626 RepID=A0A101V0C6_9ACTN|nr:hypothetical protein AQJ91_15560 [Streptomyces dysideae]